MGFVQSASGTGITSPVTVTLGAATTAGNCLIVCVGAKQGTTNPTVSGITLGGSAGNFAVAKAQNTSADTDCEIWTDQNCAGGQTSVVVSFNAGSGTGEALGVWVVEWAGLLTTAAVDQVNGANAAGTTFSSGSTGTLTQAQEVIFGAVCVSSGGSTTVTPPGSPWTELGTLTPTANVRFAAGWQQVAATTAVTYNGTDSGTSPVNGAVVVSLKIDTSVNVPLGTAGVTVTANPVLPSYPGAPVNQWSSAFAQPASFGTTPPALQSSVVALTPASSAGSGSGTPTAGNWLVCITGINETAAAAGVTVGVADDIHSFWRPAKVSTGTALTRVSFWYTPNLARVPGYVYVAPNGPCDAISVLVVEVASPGPWDTITGAAAAYSAAATTLNLALPAPAAASFTVAAVCGDDSSHGQAFAPAGWVALQTVTSTNGTDHTCDAVLTSAILPTNSGSLSVNGTASSATDLSGVIAGFQISAASPIPGGANPAWPGRMVLEAAFGSGLETPADQMTWTALSDSAWTSTAQGWKRFWGWADSSGVPYALGQLQSGTGAAQLDNWDGAASPFNPASGFYSSALNSNMSFQYGTSPWTGSNGASIAQSSAHAYASAPGATAQYSMQVTPDGVTANPGAQSERVAVTAGGTYSGSAWFYSAAGWGGGNGAQVDINWFTSGGTYISTSSTVQTPLPAATWTQVTLPGQTAPGGAAFATVIPQLLGTPAASAPFWVAEAAIVSGSSAVRTGLVTAGTPLRLRMALGTLKDGTVVNRWYTWSRNALGWPEKRNKALRGFAPVTLTDVWSGVAGSCFTPYRGEVQQEQSLYAWWACDDQLLAGGVLPASLRNSAPGNTNVLKVVLSPNGATAQQAYSTSGTALANPPAALAGEAFAQNAGWMYGDPQSSPASYQTSNPVTSNPGSASWQAAGQQGNTGSYGFFLSCNDPGFPGLSAGVTVEGWFNYAYLGSTTYDSGETAIIAQQPYCPLTLWELATGSNPVAILQLDTSGHLNFITYSGATPTSHSIYASSDMRSASWWHVAVTMTTTSWVVYLNGGVTAVVSGSAAGMTSAWTWFIANGDLGANGGSSAGTGLVHGGNAAFSHLKIYSAQLPAWRILAHYCAATTAFGVIPAPQQVTVQVTDGNSQTPSPDGSSLSGSYARPVSYSARVAAVIGAYTSGPSAWATGYLGGGSAVNIYAWVGWQGLAAKFAVYNATSLGSELQGDYAAGAGDVLTSGYGAATGGSGAAHLSGGNTGASPPAAASPLGDTVAQRIERVLGYGQVTRPDRAIDATASLLVAAATDVGGQQTGASVQNLADSDNGLLFVDNNGTLCYRSRPHLASDPVVWHIGMNVAAGMVPFESVDWSSDPQRIWDAITVTPFSPDGASLASLTPSAASAADAAQAQFGVRPKQVTSYLQDPARQQAQADWYLAQFGGLQRRAQAVAVNAATHPAGWLLVAGCNVGDVAQVYDAPFGQPATTGTYRVSGVSRSVSGGANGTQVEGRLILVLDPLIPPWT